MSNMNQVKLTPEQEKAWGVCMSMMVWVAPGFRHIFYTMLSCKTSRHVAFFTDAIPTAAIDGVHLLINPEWFFKLRLEEQVFVICHEVQHNVYNDVLVYRQAHRTGKVAMQDGTELDYRARLMNQAMDYRINPLFVDGKIGKMPKDGCYDPQVATAMDGARDIYKKLYEDDPEGENGPGGFDQILDPGASVGAQPDSVQRSDEQWKVAVKVAQHLEERRHKGDMPLGLKRMFSDILEPKVPWTEHIRTEVLRRCGSDAYNWRRPDRQYIWRDIYLPSKTGFGAGWIVCWGDTSGSISDKELARYMAELSGVMAEVNPRRLTVLWCDAAIHKVSELEDASDLDTIQGVKGGGGTCMKPVTEWIGESDERPDLLICFTDGHVDMPAAAPDFPVIWASTVSEPEHYPFGTVVMIKEEA